MWRRHTAKGKLLARGPTISIKIGMLKFGQSVLANKLPREIVCPAAMVPLLATYRELAAGEVAAAGRHLYGNRCNPTLRVFPSLLSDAAVTEELMEVWLRMTARWTHSQLLEPKRRQELLEGLVLKFWPLLHSHAVPAVPVVRANSAAPRGFAHARSSSPSSHESHLKEEKYNVYKRITKKLK